MTLDSSNPIDDYLAGVQSVEARQSLQRIRSIIREMAPDAKETISYGMPAFKLNGPFVWFAAFKNHCSLFVGTTWSDFAEELKGFKTSKGTIQFTPETPLPEELVRKLVQARLDLDLAKKPVRIRRKASS